MWIRPGSELSDCSTAVSNDSPSLIASSTATVAWQPRVQSRIGRAPGRRPVDIQVDGDAGRPVLDGSRDGHAPPLARREGSRARCEPPRPLDADALAGSDRALTDDHERVRRRPALVVLDRDGRREFPLRTDAEFVDPDEEITAVEDDPDDDKFLEASVAENVDYIVSGDRHLLDLDSFRGIDIVEPRAFYERLTPQ